MITLTSESRGWPGYRTAVAALVVAAWLVLILWAASPYAGLLDHRSLGEVHHLPLIELLAAFSLGWTLMVLAMMLPASVNAVKSLAASVPAGRNRAVPLVGFIAGYTLVWLVFGVLAYLGDSILHEMVEASTVLVPTTTNWLMGGVLLLAGLYQLTPAKRACLAACLPGAAGHDRRTGMSGQRGPFRVGLEQGLVCVGSCWALMLVMFALGGVQLGWMIVLTAVMAVESMNHAGSRLRAPLGLALMALAVVALAL